MTHDSLGMVSDLSPDDMLGLALLFLVCLGLGTVAGAGLAVLTLGRGRAGRRARGVQ